MNDDLRAKALGLLALLLAGCGRCSDEPRVPFKLPKSASDHDEPPPLPEVKFAPDAALGVAEQFAPARDQPALAGVVLPLAQVHAVLARDLDGDSDDDALVLHEDAAHDLHLSLATREPSGFATARELLALAQPALPPCATAKARIDALSATKAVATVEYTCGDPWPASLPVQSLLLLSLEANPRVYERLNVLHVADSATPPLTLTPSSFDADADGHDDVVLTARYLGASEGDALRLIWLDRPSGLVRDQREPEATLSAWAAAAQSLVAKAPEQALARAELGLSLEQALCREFGSARVALSGALGVPCATAKSTGALLGIVVAAKAKRGDISGAFSAYRDLRRNQPPPQARTLEQAASALAQLKPSAQVTLRSGPQVQPVRAPRVHLPSARFVSESLLYLQRPRPVLYDLERSEESPPPSPSDPLLRDPSGELIASAIEHTCDGVAVRIERAPPRGSDYLAAPALGWASILPLPSPPGCARGSAHPDDFGYRLLGWAPQGLLAVRGSEVRLVPLTSEGRENGPARVLAPDAPRPAPLPAGAATTDGTRYVEATPLGVLVYGPSSSKVELWRPEGYTSIAKEPLEAAISPTARRVAVVSAGNLYVLERR